jgi:hypothetical protein
VRIPWAHIEPPGVKWNAVRTGPVVGYTGDCDGEVPPQEIERILVEHLRERGYAVGGPAPPAR